MLNRFNSEHWHDEDEVRFIIEGRGLFHIHPAGRARVRDRGRGRRSDSRAAGARTTGSISAATGASARSGCSRIPPAGRRTTRTAASTRASSRSASVRRTSRRAFRTRDVSLVLRARGVRAVLLDIEGTTTPIAFVHDVLFPFARAHLARLSERRPQCRHRRRGRRRSCSGARGGARARRLAARLDELEPGRRQAVGRAVRCTGSWIAIESRRR